MIRVLLVVVIVGASLFCATAFLANEWAAWAPPGEGNPNYGRLKFVAHFYAACSVALMILACVIAMMNVPQWFNRAPPSNP